MNHRIKKISVVVLAFMFLNLPGALMAGDKRGAQLIVTRKDGQKTAGELIAVKPNSLLLLSPMGKDESVDLVEISSITIVRKSRALTGTLYGFLAGAVGGGLWGYHQAEGDMPELGAFMGGVVLGAAGGLIGLAAGAGAGIDKNIALAGLTEPAVANILARLSRHARESGVYMPRREPTKAKPAISGPKRPRFRLTWAPSLRVGGRNYYWESDVDVTFRFTEDLPPEETGPYPATLSRENTRTSLSPWRVNLAYDLSRYLSVEVELHGFSRYKTDHLGYLEFSSTLDGISYSGIFGSYEVLNSTSLLVGLCFRPLHPDFLQPHVFEVGAAAGPTWLGTSISRHELDEDLRNIGREMTWTARLYGAYEFHFSPAFFMGAFVEYRWLTADIPSYTTAEFVDFHEADDYYGSWLNRWTEVAIPGRTVSLSGLSCGLRFGLGF